MNGTAQSRKVAKELESAAAALNAGDTANAIKRLKSVLKVEPGNSVAQRFLGVAHLNRGEYQEACQWLARASAVKPEDDGLRYETALAHARAGDFATAYQHAAAAAKMRPQDATAQRLLGYAALNAGNLGEARAAYNAAVALDSNAEGFTGLCDVLRRQGDSTALLTATEAGLDRHPGNADLKAYRAEALFDAGRLAEGWADYEARFGIPRHPIPPLDVPLPQWQGEPLGGRAIVVYAEQGIGDEILYASMIPDLVTRAARVRLQCSLRLESLFRRSFPGVEIVTVRDPNQLAAGMNYASPIGNLGRWLRPDFTAFPAHAGYLNPDPQLVARLKAKYAAATGQTFLVGIAWRSNTVRNAADKTIDLKLWGAIFSVPKVAFVSLQYGAAQRELEDAKAGFGVSVLHDPEIDPLGDADAYAAQVAAMDLVITSSNTTAHVAGALGVPTICMIPRTAGLGQRWYWFAAREVCPWYPSVQRSVQERAGDWMAPVAHAALGLATAAFRAGALTNPFPYLYGLAKSYRAAGLQKELICVLEATVALRPADQDPYVELSRIKKQAKDLEGALGVLDAAIKAIPGHPYFHNLRGVVLMDLGRTDEALASYRDGLKLAPEALELHNNIGTALRRLGRMDEAIAHYREAVEQAPDNLKTLLNLGGGLSEVGESEGAIAIWRRMLALDPDHVDAHYNLALTLLNIERLAAGWREFTWRWKRPDASVQPALFRAPLWSGAELAGKAVLTYTEQGIGDEILCASMFPDLIAAAGRVTMLCTSRLVPLFRRSFPGAIVEVLDDSVPPAALAADLDVQMSMTELGMRFRNAMSDFPAQPHYLRADPEHVARLREKYRTQSGRSKLIGVSWRSAHPEIGHRKSLSLQDWTPIFKAAGDAAFVNLQYGDTAKERAGLVARSGVELMHDPDVDPLIDMDAAAAQIAAMDLVISVSNTAVHTAGALGVPTWALLSATTGGLWYWFRGREDSPWYPSVKLFRAAKDGTWAEVVARIVSELSR